MLALEKYRFFIESDLDMADERLSFKAEFILLNRSGVDIDFDLIAHCGEEKPVQFILRNSEEVVLWKYIFLNPLVGCPDFLDEFTLPDNDVLRHGIDVPLVIEDEVLKPGEYTL